MKTKLKYFGMMAIIIFSLIACQKTVMSPEPKTDDQWTYRFTNYDSVGNVTAVADRNFTANGYDKEFASEIQPWVSVREDGFNYSTGFPCADYRMFDDGLFTLKNLSLGGVPSKFLPFPGVVGNTITHVDNSIYVYGATIVSTTDTLTVPFGHFSNLYRYDLDYVQIPNQNLWFNDSVWFVRYEIFDTATTGLYLSESVELVNYMAH